MCIRDRRNSEVFAKGFDDSGSGVIFPILGHRIQHLHIDASLLSNLLERLALACCQLLQPVSHRIENHSFGVDNPIGIVYTNSRRADADRPRQRPPKPAAIRIISQNGFIVGNSEVWGGLPR